MLLRHGLKGVCAGLRLSLLIACTLAGATASQATSSWAGECMLSSAEIAEWRTGNELVIVDTRSAADFRRVRIPGSINLPAQALKTKLYLQDKVILLVGLTGRGRELEPICRSMRESEFARVGIVEGGLNSWSSHGGVLTGAGTREVNRMSPADLVRDGVDARWLIIDVTTPSSIASIHSRQAPSSKSGRSTELARKPDETVPVSMLQIQHMPEKQFRSAIQAAMMSHEGGAAATFVLLTNRDGKGYDRIARELAPLAIAHLYFLSDGIDGYRRYREQQKQIAQSVARGCTLNECGTR